jgi:hypothetical protein
MTGDRDILDLASQRPSHRRPSDARPCRAREQSINCVIPGDAVTGWCPRHDPDQADARRLQALQAARTSHTPRALKPLTGEEWANPDFDTAEARLRFREALVAASGRGELDDKRAALWLKAVDGAMAEDHGRKGGKSPAAGPVIVEVARFDVGHQDQKHIQNGSAE